MNFVARTKQLGVLIGATLALVMWLAFASPASARDRNHDRIPDRWEKRHHLSLKVKQTKKDQDRDHLRNIKEWQEGTNPRDPDTDNDGMEDGDEVEVGDDPTDEDTDDDGVEDGEENAGTIASFDSVTGVLTITLLDGSTVSGRVTDATDLECESAMEFRNEDEVGDEPPAEGGEPSGEEGGEEPGDEGDLHPCSVGDLRPGRAVREAELMVTPEGSVFEAVEVVVS